jgi:hypothetical protein
MLRFSDNGLLESDCFEKKSNSEKQHTTTKKILSKIEKNLNALEVRSKQTNINNEDNSQVKDTSSITNNDNSNVSTTYNDNSTKIFNENNQSSVNTKKNPIETNRDANGRFIKSDSNTSNNDSNTLSNSISVLDKVFENFGESYYKSYQELKGVGNFSLSLAKSTIGRIAKISNIGSKIKDVKSRDINNNENKKQHQQETNEKYIRGYNKVSSLNKKVSLVSDKKQTHKADSNYSVQTKKINKSNHISSTLTYAKKELHKNQNCVPLCTNIQSVKTIGRISKTKQDKIFQKQNIKDKKHEKIVEKKSLVSDKKQTKLLKKISKQDTSSSILSLSRFIPKAIRSSVSLVIKPLTKIIPIAISALSSLNIFSEKKEKINIVKKHYSDKKEAVNNTKKATKNNSNRLIKKESSLSKYNPFKRKKTSSVVSKLGEKSLGKLGAKSLGKGVLKKIPLLGTLAGLGFAVSRLMDGDVKGAGLEALSGLVSNVPVVGTMASIGIDGYLAKRDYDKTKDVNTEKITKSSSVVSRNKSDRDKNKIVQSETLEKNNTINSNTKEKTKDNLEISKLMSEQNSILLKMLNKDNTVKLDKETANTLISKKTTTTNVSNIQPTTVVFTPTRQSIGGL